MRVAFFNEAAARAAVDVFGAYGYRAEQIGNDVETDCPPLLAVPAIERSIGFGRIARVDVTRRRGAAPVPPHRPAQPEGCGRGQMSLDCSS